MADRLFKDVCQVGGRIGGDDQGVFAFISKAHGMGTGHAGFAHAAFARKENELSAHPRTPFKFVLISVSVGYSPTLTTFPRTKVMGSAAICCSRTRRMISSLFKKARGWFVIWYRATCTPSACRLKIISLRSNKV